MLASIIIPVYNEKKTVRALLSRVESADTPNFEKQCIVVDDASTDGTSEILDEYAKGGGIALIRLPANSGKASAIKSGLKSAKGDIILIQDADLEYSPEDYGRLLAPFSDSSVKVVYGSRFMERAWPEKMKAPYWIANRFFTLLVNLLYGARITDEGTAYKAFRREVIMSLEIRSSGFEFCPEVTAKILKKGIDIIEVPISYEARDKRGGKKPGYQDGLKVLWTIIKYRFRR